MNIILNSVKKNGASINQKFTQQQGRELLTQMICISLADGKISSEERQMLDIFAKNLGFNNIDIDMMMRYEQAALYSEAKEETRNKNK